MPEWAGSGKVVGASMRGRVRENRCLKVLACLSRSVKGKMPKMFSIVASMDVWS